MSHSSRRKQLESHGAAAQVWHGNFHSWLASLGGGCFWDHTWWLRCTSALIEWRHCSGRTCCLAEEWMFLVLSFCRSFDLLRDYWYVLWWHPLEVRKECWKPRYFVCRRKNVKVQRLLLLSIRCDYLGQFYLRQSLHDRKVWRMFLWRLLSWLARARTEPVLFDGKGLRRYLGSNVTSFQKT